MKGQALPPPPPNPSAVVRRDAKGILMRGGIQSNVLHVSQSSTPARAHTH